MEGTWVRPGIDEERSDQRGVIVRIPAAIRLRQDCDSSPVVCGFGCERIDLIQHIRRIVVEGIADTPKCLTECRLFDLRLQVAPLIASSVVCHILLCLIVCRSERIDCATLR
eukprot:scaffold3572_cov125-Isochrysis_galbana.AAC.3